jgi:hypothetical protein
MEGRREGEKEKRRKKERKKTVLAFGWEFSGRALA